MEGNPVSLKKSRSELAVCAIYASMTAYIAADQLLSPFLPSTFVRVFELICLAAMAWFVLELFLYRQNFRYRGWPLLLFALLMISCVSIIARGDYGGGIKDLVLQKFSYTQIPAYILPFIVLVMPNRKYLTSILNVLFFSMLAVIPIWLLQSINLVQEEFDAESIGAYLPLFGAVLILFRRHLSSGRRLVVYALYFVYFMLMVLNARRNMVVSLSLFFIIAFLMGNITMLKTSMRARLLLLSGVAAAAAIVVATWGGLSTTVFQRILYRGTEDTRSSVEILFLADMATSPEYEWVIGRGIDGSYSQRTEDKETLEVSYERPSIETGYLHMILKGGLFHVLVILSFLFTALIRGVSTKKHLLQGLALFLTVYLIDFYMTNWTLFFSVKAVLFWFIVSICLQYRK